MKTVGFLIRAIDLINEKVARLFAWLMVPLILALVYEVLVRYVFKSPTLWSYDVTYMLSSLVIVMGLGYTWQAGGHVHVDFITEKLPPRVAALVRIVFHLGLFFLCWVLLLKTFVPHLQASWFFAERAKEGTWLPPIYPYKTWIFCGLFLMTLQGVSETLKDITKLIKGGESS